MTDLVTGFPKRNSPSSSRWMVAVSCIIIGSLAVTGQLSAQSLPMTPPVQQALKDTTLVRQIPGRFQVKVRSFDRRETAHERSAMEAQLNGIVALLRRDPAFASPVGIDADVQIETGIPETDGDARLISGLVHIFTWPFMVSDKHVVYNNALAASFNVNEDICESGNPVVRGSHFYLSRLRTGDYHGFPTLDSIVVVTHRAPPPCIPVSRADYLSGMARAMSHASDSDPAQVAAAKREQESALQEMARTNPTMAAEERTQIAAMQRLTDSIKLSLTQRYAAPLARMSPGERSSPAYMVENSCADAETGCLVSPGTADARMVVRPNPAFFDASRPTDVQLVTVDLRHILDQPNPPDQFVVDLMSRALSQFDWAALGALVR